MQRVVVFAAFLLLLALAAATWSVAGPRQAALAAIGCFAGIALYHAAFGFASAWRNVFVERQSLGLRAQLVMLAATIVVFHPLIAMGSAFGQPVWGFVNPVGLALVVGAFLFGIGMQIGGGCGSGTLYTAGGGSTRMLLTLAAFVCGSVLATADPLNWRSWWAFDGISLVTLVGWPASVAVSLGLLAVAHVSASAFEFRRRGEVAPLLGRLRASPTRGPWPLLAGALALAAVNVATLVVAGHPWGITAAFALWGAKLLAGAGVDVAAWPYWSGEPALSAPVLADATSVMNLAVMIGALAAAGLAGRFRPTFRLSRGAILGSLLGGLLMGLGARLATGCNIGAFFSGTASGSLHGLVWMMAAVPGVLVGIRFRQRLNL